MAKRTRNKSSKWEKSLRNALKPLSIAGRGGTLHGGFWKAVAPLDTVMEDDLRRRLERFTASNAEPNCVYCGGRGTDWDHLLAPAENGRLSGFGSLLSNLVPACGTCNQSKGSKPWRTWLEGGSGGAASARGKPGHATRVSVLATLEQEARAGYRDLSAMTESDRWTRYLALLEELKGGLAEADRLAAELRTVARPRSP